MEVLKVDRLRKVYGSGDALVEAVKDVSFSVDKGEFVAIIGPSGSGKSTLLHLLGGVERPSSGTVTVEGTNLYGLDETKLAIFRRRQIGLIYQFYNLLPVLTVEENISLPVFLDDRTVNQTHMDMLIHMLGLENRRKHLPSQLSGGQQQRVSIGRALVHNPSIMLADEPTGNLDRKTSNEILELLKMANQKFNQTLIMITHDESIALQADRIITIEDGMLKSDERLRNRVGGIQ